MLRGSVDTRENSGNFQKNVLLLTNDPDKPSITVPVSLVIKPVFNVESGLAGSVSSDDAGRAQYSVFLKFAPGAPRFHVTDSALVGLPGSLITHEVRDAKGQLLGYRFLATVTHVETKTRVVAEVSVLTDDPNFRHLRFHTYVQNGVVCLPSEIYLGGSQDQPEDLEVDVLRPGRPFRIISASSSLPQFQVKTEPLKDQGYRLLIRYDGHLGAGPVLGQLYIDTDVPSQRHIELKIAGSLQ
jgi:hypothetical protein